MGDDVDVFGLVSGPKVFSASIPVNRDGRVLVVNAFASEEFFVRARVFLMLGALENSLQPAHILYASEQI